MMNALQLSSKFAAWRFLCSATRRGLKIYTKTGDAGTSVTYSGERRPKFDPIFEALGTSDELSSSIGHARSFMKSQNLTELKDELCKIQCILQDLQSSIATPQNAPVGMLEKVRNGISTSSWNKFRKCRGIPEILAVRRFILSLEFRFASTPQPSRSWRTGSMLTARASRH